MDGFTRIFLTLPPSVKRHSPTIIYKIKKMAKNKEKAGSPSEKSVSMRIINEHAAGIDVGSRSHFVAVGQDLKNDVREFGVFDLDLRECASWLKSRGVLPRPSLHGYVLVPTIE